MSATLIDAFGPLVREGNLDGIVFMVEELLEEVEAKSKRESEALRFIKESVWDYRDNKPLFYEVTKALVNDRKLKK